MFFARAKDSPKWKKMAKHWQAATGKRKLPKKVDEEDELYDEGPPPPPADHPDGLFDRPQLRPPNDDRGDDVTPKMSEVFVLRRRD